MSDLGLWHQVAVAFAMLAFVFGVAFIACYAASELFSDPEEGVWGEVAVVFLIMAIVFGLAVIVCYYVGRIFP